MPEWAFLWIINIWLFLILERSSKAISQTFGVTVRVVTQGLETCFVTGLILSRLAPRLKADSR